MRRASSLILVAVLAAVVAGVGPVAGVLKGEDKPVNLLVNGSFEEGPEAGEFVSLDKDNTDIKGWVVTRGQIDYIGTYWQHADGKRSLDLHGSPGFGGVSQKFKTQKGQKYRLTFSLAGNPDGGVAEKKLGVEAAGKKAEFKFDTTGKSVTEMGWKTHTWDFTAEADETTLEIYTLTTEGDAFGPALDNVSVVKVDK